MAVDAYPSPRPLFDRTVAFARVNWEVLAYAGLTALALLLRLWDLGSMAMHHDEGVHAWSVYKMYAGTGGFTCGYPATGRSEWYCYDPVYHGPTLYFLGLLAYFLFGDGDAQARLPMALAGAALVGSAWMLRPYLGRRGALIAAILFAGTPSLLYFTRFARHDALHVLFLFWSALGIWRYIHGGRPAWLYLGAIGTALTMATHEIYYLQYMIFTAFLLVRVWDESPWRRWLMPTLLAGLAVCALILYVNPIIPLPAAPGQNEGRNLDLGEKGLLIGFVIALQVGALLLWDRRPFVLPRMVELWRERRPVLLLALVAWAVPFVLLYSSFFTYPRGVIDGLYAGLRYWLGAHDLERIFQPWYYYLMLLPVYEPLIVVSAIGILMTLVTWRIQAARAARTARGTLAAPAGEEPAAPDDSLPAGAADVPPSGRLAPEHTFLLFVCVWFAGALFSQSWAGEKVPWLMVHLTVPGYILVAWAIERLLRTVDGVSLRASRAWLVIPAVILLVPALSIAIWRLSAGAADQAAQSRLLLGLAPLAVAGGLIYLLLAIGARTGTRVVLALTALTISAILGAYTVRSAWRAVYEQPDVPVELLVYVQTAPNVPLLVDEIEQLAIAQTRNRRSPEDVTGGRSMPIIMDTELAWPMEWYLRRYTAVYRQTSDFFRDASPASFVVDGPGGVREPAPIVLVYKPNMTETARSALEADYVLRYDTVFNWWFVQEDYQQFDAPGDWYRALSWPLDPANWETIARYMLYRDKTNPPGAREMEVWVRRDLAGAGDAGGGVGTIDTYKLVAEQIYGAFDADQTSMVQPRGVAVDPAGNIYVSDTERHRIVVFGPDGALIRTFGTFGGGPGQFNEPRGLAIDPQGNLLVADTWNARVVRLTPEGRFLGSWGVGNQDLGGGRVATLTGATAEANLANPLGFFGPRAVAVDARGNVYIADTGNRRIVVTDGEGRYRYQFGYEGSERGAFREPLALALDAQGNLYVGDAWNSRVQVFAPGGEQLSPIPVAAWPVAGWEPNAYDDPGLTVSPDGQVFLTVPGRNLVVRFDQNGTPTLRWGGQGNDRASFNLPSGVTLGPDGKAYVVDRANGRVMRFALP